MEHPPSALDLRRLEVFAAQAAVGLLNARLYQASQQDRARLRAILRERRVLRRQVVDLTSELRDSSPYHDIIGASPVMREVLAELEQVAASDVTVLLLGETGSGKELFARALHARSARSKRPFVPVNCAALPEQLVESELFGHERGAFTGAHMRKAGRFELAHHGTLFLDEIGDLPANAQAKLLRVLQDGEVQRVGSTQGLKVDVRIVAATNQDLSARVAKRAFREDLFFRLSVFPIQVPPLRDRAGDIPLLARHLTAHYARRIGKRVSGMTDEALEALTRHSWPGNVRELQNVIERAIILCNSGVISADMIRLDGRVAPRDPELAPVVKAGGEATSDGAVSNPVTLADAEREAIIRALRQAEGRVSGDGGAAAVLGLKPTTLHAKMTKLGVRRGDAMHAPASR
jgi:formate hydrogenlyase transcriptional activator